jgi:DNA-binding NtrC family response regulator
MQTATRPKRILIVDDDYAMRDLLRSALKNQGYEVRVACDAEQALDFVAAGDRSDAVVADIRLPEMDGLQMVRLLRADHPGAKVVFMTAFANPVEYEKALALGAVDYLVKPFNLRRLILVLGHALAEEPSEPVRRKEAADNPTDRKGVQPT